MKKIFASLVVLLAMMCSQNAFAAIVTPMAEGEFQEYINKVGFKILNKNESRSTLSLDTLIVRLCTDFVPMIWSYMFRKELS